jgi:glycosyltransferase involved in cell wall biosynthesis
MAITNKFCEYVAAGIPIVTSDTPAQAELVDGLDLGAVHRAGDVRDCAQAIRLVLNDLGRLSARIRSDDDLRHRFSWEAQAAVVRDLYAALLGALPPQAWMPDSTKVRRLLVHD